MRAMDIMTTEVLTVAPTTSVQEVAKLLSERGISGVPVVNSDNQVVGILSEGDLLHRAETGTERVRERQRSWWLESLASDLARDYVKAHARTAQDVMTRDVVSVYETTPLADVATLLETKRIKRVPVLRAGKLVGICCQPRQFGTSGRDRRRT
jgi:CBS domain-containing protein